jgi:predicted MFS family arabinose efflux permease
MAALLCLLGIAAWASFWRLQRQHREVDYALLGLKPSTQSAWQEWKLVAFTVNAITGGAIFTAYISQSINAGLSNTFSTIGYAVFVLGIALRYVLPYDPGYLDFLRPRAYRKRDFGRDHPRNDT